MPIVPTTPQEAIARRLEEKIQERRLQLSRHLSFLGEQCLNEARASGSYTDRTGNLRSSLGYVVLYNGSPVSPATIQPDSLGGKEAEEALQRAQAEAPQTGFVLIVVAGMHYAPYVAALGYDVLESAESLARREVPALLDKLRLKWSKK